MIGSIHRIGVGIHYNRMRFLEKRIEALTAAQAM